MVKDRTTTLIPDNATLITEDIEVASVTDSTGTYNVLRLKDIRPSGAESLIDFTLNRQDLWSLDPLDDISSQGIETLGGVELTGTEFVAYFTHQDINSQKFTVHLQWMPSYSGNPAADVGLFTFSGDIDPGFSIQRVNSVIFRHLMDGNLELVVYDNTGLEISSATFPFTAVEDHEVLFQFTIDNTVRENQEMLKLYIDGIAIPCISPDDGLKKTLALIPVIDRFDIGNVPGVASTSNFTIHEMAIFKDVVFTESHQVVPLPFTVYSADPQSAYLKEIISTERLIEFSQYIMDSNVKIILEVKQSNGIWLPRYYDTVTSKWLNSDGTYSQSNFPTDYTERLLYHIWHEPADIRVKIILFSIDGLVKSVFERTNIKYDWYLTSIPEIHYTLVYGVIRGSDNQKKSDFSVTAEINGRSVYANKILMFPEKKEAVTDERGYWELLIPTTVDMTTGTYFTFTLNPTTLPRVEMCTIPKVPQIEFEELVKNHTFADELV